MRINQIRQDLRLALENSLNCLSKKNLPSSLSPTTEIELEIPKDQKHGDLTTNVAMRLAKRLSQKGIDLANSLRDELAGRLACDYLEGVISKIEVSDPGFINFWFSKEYLHGFLSVIKKERVNYGRNNLGRGSKANIEFVSANPTGPLTIAHGRQAAVGDALGRILEFSGYRVCREYFINDVGVQIDLLGESIFSRYLSQNGIKSKFPEEGYRGKYIEEIAGKLNRKYGKRFIKSNPKDLQFIAMFGIKSILKPIKADLERFGVLFDRWFSQRTLSPKKIKGVLNRLKAKGYIYEKDEAVWFKSTSFGDDKDRVVIKGDGNFTYLAPDIAYHLDKYNREFQKLIDIWGPDHHGYVPRLTSAVLALGYDKSSISILIVQLATLFRDGVALSMSTRKGEFITLKEVMDEVGCDVAKFFFLMRKINQHLDFDLEVAKRDSLDNPVYYIQYAHARIASILRFSDRLKNRLRGIRYNPRLLSEPETLLLLRMVSQFPLVVESSAKTLEPYRLVDYLNELAKVFHNFYTKHRVVSDGDLPLTKARLTLVNGIKIVLANGLRLLGISLPERM